MREIKSLFRASRPKGPNDDSDKSVAIEIHLVDGPILVTLHTVKALLFLPGGGGGGAYLISDPKIGGAYLIERGAYFKSHIFDEIHNNFPYFTILPITKTEQENGFYRHFTFMQRHLYPNSALLLEIKSKGSDWNKKKYCWSVIYIGHMLKPSLLFSILSVISRGWGGGLNREGGLLQNLTAKGGGGLFREGGLIERGRLNRAFMVVVLANWSLADVSGPIESTVVWVCVAWPLSGGGLLDYYQLIFQRCW